MKHKSILSALLLTVILSLAIIPPASSQPVSPEPPILAETQIKQAYATDHILVKLQPGAQLASSTEGTSLNALYTDLGVRSTQAVFANDPAQQVMRLNLSSNADIEAVVAQLEQNPNVLWAEPDYLAYAADTTPNDPQFASQWGLTQIDAPAAWDVVTGTQGTVIAVLDSGMDLTHEDLATKLWVNPGEVADNGIDDDNNGFIDDINGWDFVNDSNDPGDDNGHGTQVAGIAAAVTNNSTGMAGVCWGCRIMPVKVMQISGAANYSDIAAGVIYAAKKGANIINLSLGGYYNSTTLATAIESAVNDYGAVIIGGAGNDDTSDMFYPAAYDAVLAVAGTDSTDAKVNSSNYGDWIDVSAPGESITAPFYGGGYGPVNGTSYAAPFVSGLAGLIHSQNPTWSPELIQAQIIKTVEDIDASNPTYAGQLGSGRINADQAVTTVPHPILTLDGTAIDGDPSGKPTAGEQANLTLTLANDWLEATGVQGTLTSADAKVSITTGTASFGDIASGSSADSTSDFVFTVDASAGYSYDIIFNLVVTANSGAYSTNIPVTVTTRSANEPVAGTIAVDTTWTNDKTYIVTNNVGVAPGVTLTIEAGTTVLFDGDFALNVGGTLVARGTEATPIIFDANEGVTEWTKIHFDDTVADAHVDANNAYLSGSVLEWVEIEGARYGVTGEGASPLLNHITITDGEMGFTPGDTIRAGETLTDTVLLTNSNIDGTIFIGGNIDILQSHIQLNRFNDREALIYAYGASVVSSTIDINSENTLGIYLASESAPAYIHANTFQETYQNSRAIEMKQRGIISNNRFLGFSSAITANEATIQGNLFANGNRGISLSGESTVISNTFTGNSGASIWIYGAVEISGNNFEGNSSTYDVECRVDKTIVAMIMAQNNWWGTTDITEIGQRIFDYNDDYTKGQVLFTPLASAPITDAPAYVRGVAMSPDSVVGIETAMFEVEFSKEMNTDTNADICAFPAAREDIYEIEIDPLPSHLFSIIDDLDQSMWISSCCTGVYHYDEVLTQYNNTNSGLLGTDIRCIAIDTQGTKWFGGDEGVSIYDGTNWSTYHSGNSNLDSNQVNESDWCIADQNDDIWFITHTGIDVAANQYNGESWIVHNSTNSPLSNAYLLSIATDSQNNVWIGGIDALWRYNGNNWMEFTGETLGFEATINFDRLIIDSNNDKWFISSGDVYQLRESDWIDHNLSAHDLYLDHNDDIWAVDSNNISRYHNGNWTTTKLDIIEIDSLSLVSMTIDENNIRWFITHPSRLLYQKWGFDYDLGYDEIWGSETVYQMKHDFNALIPRDTYSLTVQSAEGIDGMEIAPYSNFTFTVDYAGAIADTTAPSQPEVFACGSSNVSTLSAYWEAIEEDGTIDGYHYAIGTTPGGVNVVDWTPTTATSFNKTNLSLVAGQTYYVSVQARNAGGIWGDIGSSTGVVAGSGTCPTASFTASPLAGEAPLNVNFTNSSSGSITDYLWDFGDGNTSTQQAPSHIYTTPGTYTVKLRVSGPGGSQQQSRTDYLTVNQPASGVTAYFTASPTTGNTPLTVTFTDGSAGDINSWSWDFGDGDTSTTRNPAHTYYNDGLFTVSLTVNGPGGTDQQTRVHYINVGQSEQHTVYMPISLR